MASFHFSSLLFSFLHFPSMLATAHSAAAAKWCLFCRQQKLLSVSQTSECMVIINIFINFRETVRFSVRNEHQVGWPQGQGARFCGRRRTGTQALSFKMHWRTGYVSMTLLKLSLTAIDIFVYLNSNERAPYNAHINECSSSNCAARCNGCYIFRP